MQWIATDRLHAITFQSNVDKDHDTIWHNYDPVNWIYSENRLKINFVSEHVLIFRTYVFNTVRPGQNGFHFADQIFECIFFNEIVCILIEISLNFVPKDQINNIPNIQYWLR